MGEGAVRKQELVGGEDAAWFPHRHQSVERLDHLVEEQSGDFLILLALGLHAVHPENNNFSLAHIEIFTNGNKSIYI